MTAARKELNCLGNMGLLEKAIQEISFSKRGWGKQPELPCLRRAGAGPTDGAVLSVPALAAFALAILARAVLGAARVAGPLAAGGAGPALFTATRAPHAHSVRAAVHGADFCMEQKKQSRKGGEGIGEGERVWSKQGSIFNSKNRTIEKYMKSIYRLSTF